MAIRNPQITERTADIREGIEMLKDAIGRTSDDLRRIVGEEYDSYTKTQKELAEEVFAQRNMFFNPDGTARAMVGSEPNRYAGKMFDDALLGRVIREAAPLYKTPDTMGEGLVNREYKEQFERDRFQLETRPRPDTFYQRRRKEAEEKLPSEVDDFSGYAEGMNRIETEFDPESPNFRQKLAEGGEADSPLMFGVADVNIPLGANNPSSGFFTSQRTYTPKEYASGFVNFYGGSLGTGVDVTTLDEDEDEDEDEKETVIRQDVLRPAGSGEDSIVSPTQYTFGQKGRQSAFDVRSFQYGDGSSDFDLNINNFAKAGTQDLSDSFVKDYMKATKGPGIQADVKKEGAIAPISAGMGPVLATAAGTFMGKQVEAPFGKETTLRPAGLAGFALDAALHFHTKNAAAVNLVGGKAGSLMTVNNMMISRKPGDYIYTGNLGNLSQQQMLGIEATKEGFISGTLKDEYDSETNTWSKTGMKGLMDADTAFRVGGNVSETGYFISTFGGGAKLTGAAGTKNEQFAAAYDAARSKYGVTEAQFVSALQEAQAKAGAFGTVSGKHRDATYLSDALARTQRENAMSDKTIAQQTAAETPQSEAAAKAGPQDSGGGDDDSYTAAQAEADIMESFGGSEDAADYSFDFGGGYRKGGRVGLQQGGQAMATPAGFVEGPPSKFSDGQKVADDKNMQVEEGTFVINAAAVEEAGSQDIKKMILEAYAAAREQGVFEVDRPVYEKAVDVAVSRGEVIIPPQLARIIGYDRLRKINNRGKKETQERIEESGQQPTGAAGGGFLSRLFGFGNKESQPDVSGTPAADQGFVERPQDLPAGPIEAAEPSTPLPPPSEYEKTVRSALQVAEDNKKTGYVPTNNSGVTIGRGFDIGQHSITDLERMGLSSKMLTKLTPYVGKKNEQGRFVPKVGAKARAALKKDPLTIEDQKVLEDLNLTVQRKKHEEFEAFLKSYNIPSPNNPVDRAIMFTEYYVGNFKTKSGKGKEGSFHNKDKNRHVTIRHSFLKGFQGGDAYDALYDGIIMPLRGKSSNKARQTRNRADRMISWYVENKDFPSVTEPMLYPTPKPEKPERPLGVLPKPKPKRDSSATR